MHRLEWRSDRRLAQRFRHGYDGRDCGRGRGRVHAHVYAHDANDRDVCVHDEPRLNAPHDGHLRRVDGRHARHAHENVCSYLPLARGGFGVKIDRIAAI